MRTSSSPGTSTAKSRTRINRSIIDVDGSVWLVGPGGGQGGGENTWLDDNEVAEYNGDPDLFAAKYYGFATVDEYCEWLDAGGAPLCSELTKTGRLCRNSTGMAYRSEDWRQRHRAAPCFLHATAVDRPKPPASNVAKRCNAIVSSEGGWPRSCLLQYSLNGKYFRDGRWVCLQHLYAPVVRYVCGNHFEVFAEVMAKALGNPAP
jgi:hypothetical protein